MKQQNKWNRFFSSSMALLVIGILSNSIERTTQFSSNSFTFSSPIIQKRDDSASKSQNVLSTQIPTSSTALYASFYDRRGGRGSASYDRSKRQERVGHLVRNEIAMILQRGFPIIQNSYEDDGGSQIPEDLRRRISLVNVDVSPDLRQARITVSIRGSSSDNASLSKQDQMMDKRRAYSWLVSNTKSIRHALSKRMKHSKVLPNLTFVQADVGAAVDVMSLIDKISSDDGYKRQDLDDIMKNYVPKEDRETMGSGNSGGEDDGWLDDDDEDEFYDVLDEDYEYDDFEDEEEVVNEKSRK